MGTCAVILGSSGLARPATVPALVGADGLTPGVGNRAARGLAVGAPEICVTSKAPGGAPACTPIGALGAAPGAVGAPEICVWSNAPGAVAAPVPSGV